MAEDKKKFILYEYLLYFGKKKKYFILIPLITTLLIFGLIYALKGNGGYNGKALVYTGSVDSGDFTHPNNLKADFEKINPNVEVFVSGRNQVKITVKGDSKAKVEEDLEKIVSSYNKKLQAEAEQRMGGSTPYVEELEESYKAKEDLLEFYQNKLKGGSLTPGQYQDTAELIRETAEDIADEKAEAHKMRNTISLFEYPKVLSKEIAKEDTFLKESIVAGLLLGLVLTFAFLILLKYIEEARRYYKR